MVKEVWMVAREMGGWAEAGGVKDVVRDQAKAFPNIGWKVKVVLPLYGFLERRVAAEGTLTWSGTSCHPRRPVALEVWQVREHGYEIYFVKCPSLAGKNSPYTYTATDEAINPRQTRGEGFSDGYEVNLEYQWAVVSFWRQTATTPVWVIGHDGHIGFVPAIAKTAPVFGGQFQNTTFALMIHNAGPHYRQEMPASTFHDEVISLSPAELKSCLLDHNYDPMVSASLHGKLGTVSKNYAQELLTGKNDHWSGPFGKWLRTSQTPLEGITNGLSTDDKDPRDPEAAGIPAGFDPLRGRWEGKVRCRQALRDTLVLRPSSLHGALSRWEGPLYVMQGRLTAQKGVDALYDLVARGLRDKPRALFLVMAQGERRYEEKMINLARENLETGRFLFVNKFEEPLARLVFAAGDFFLMPSEYEPCGLTDIKAQLMGTLPIVHRVGGLVKVKDGETGFSYDKHENGGLWGAFLRSLTLWESDPGLLEKVRRQAFASAIQDYQWEGILEQKYLPWLTDPVRFPILSSPLPT